MNKTRMGLRQHTGTCFWDMTCLPWLSGISSKLSFPSPHTPWRHPPTSAPVLPFFSTTFWNGRQISLLSLPFMLGIFSQLGHLFAAGKLHWEVGSSNTEKQGGAELSSKTKGKEFCQAPAWQWQTDLKRNESLSAPRRKTRCSEQWCFWLTIPVQTGDFRYWRQREHLHGLYWPGLDWMCC